MLLLPLGVLLWKALQVSPELLNHISEYLLWEALQNTLLILVGVTALSSFLGVSFAWLMARYEFYGRNFFRWALILPLGLPAYIVAFVWVAHLGQDFAFLKLILVLSFCLFPYIYLIVLESFERINKTHFEVARSLGLSRYDIVKRIYVPMLRPSLMAGVLLVGMETLADFGSVSVFNISVLTTLLYRSWFSLQSFETAAFLAFIHILVLVVFVLLAFRVSRSHVVDKSAGKNKQTPKLLSPLQSLSVSGLMLIFWCVSFVWPVAEIVLWSAHDAWAFVDARLWERIANSLLIATGAAFVTLWMAVLMWVAKRYYNSRWILWALRLSGLGYGIPGTVIAVGWMVSLTLIFGSFHHLPFVVLAALILGLATRFLSLAQRPLDAASERISKQLEEAARSLGASRDRVCWLIHRPLLSGAMGIGFLFVFIDSIKEMPMTLLMRPFGWDTLSVRVYQFTSDGLWQAAAAPALVIVLVSTLPLFVLRKQLR